jgi:hypothetical protein
VRPRTNPRAAAHIPGRVSGRWRAPSPCGRAHFERGSMPQVSGFCWVVHEMVWRLTYTLTSRDNHTQLARPSAFASGAARGGVNIFDRAGTRRGLS